MRADEVAKVWKYLTEDEKNELITLVDGDSAIWRPQPGPQADAFYCEADVTGFGGSAGGGKSDLISGLSLTEHKRIAIFRREKAQTERIVQRLGELLGGTVGLNSQKGIWQLGGGHIIEFAGLDNPTDHTRWQGRDHDLKCYDEVTEMREAQVRYTMGWNRSADPKVRSRVLMTFNPPTTAEGRWVIAYFAPWLDPRHPNPAKPGEIRWFTTIQDKDVEVPDNRPFVLVGERRIYAFDPEDHRPEEIIKPKSRTFIPSRVTDNPYYMATDYISTLQALPEPLRSQMLKGDFQAGVRDDEMQVIPTAWIDAAMNRWEPRPNGKGEMDSIGSDPARGGPDVHVISRRHGTWFDELVLHPGKETPDGPTGAAQILQERRDEAPIHIDIIGWGAAVFDALVANNLQTIGVNASATSYQVAKEGGLKFANMRAELVWQMREALSPTNPIQISLPKDPILAADLAAYKWKFTIKGIQIRDKAEMKVQLGRSPDRGDAVCLANRATVKTRQFEAFTAEKPYNSYDDLER